MKRLLVLLIVVISLKSCVVISKNDYKIDFKKNMEPNVKALIVKTNGERIVGNKISIREFGRRSKPSIFTIDGVKISEVDVLNYQDENGFYKKYSKWWARLICKGKINLYYFVTFAVSYNGPNMKASTSATEYFVYQKDNGEMKGFSNKDLADFLKDNTEAFNLFNSLYSKNGKYSNEEISAKNIVEIIDLYNK